MRRYAEVRIRLIIDETNQALLTQAVRQAVLADALDAGEVEVKTKLGDPIKINEHSYAVALPPIEDFEIPLPGGQKCPLRN